MFFIELLLTNNCNAHCNYCSFTKNVSQTSEVDIDYLRYILKCLPCDLFLEISGGEPGLISNLDDVILTLVNSKNCKKIQIMSNGLVRHNNIFNSIFCDPLIESKLHLYNEHLILNIDKNNILEKLYNYDFLHYNKYRNIIVLTPSVLNNISVKFMNEIKPFTIFKILIPNTLKTTSDYYKKLNAFKSIIFEPYLNDIKYTASRRKLCGCYSHNPSIHLQFKKIYHCTIFHTVCDKKEVSKDNLEKLLKGTLFTYKDYCSTCNFYDLDESKYQKYINVKKNKTYTNRSYGWYW